MTRQATRRASPSALFLAFVTLILLGRPADATVSYCMPFAVVDPAGEIYPLWKQHIDIGCPVSRELNGTPEKRIQNFALGQIAYVARPNLTRSLVATISTKNLPGSTISADDRIKLIWNESSASTYQYWELVWQRDYAVADPSPAGTQSCEQSGACIAHLPVGGTFGACSISNSDGCYELVGLLGDGNYKIAVRGCKLVSTTNSSVPECTPFDSAAVSFGGFDLFEIPAAQTFQETKDLYKARADAVNRYACRQKLEFERKDRHFGEDMTSIVLAKLYFASDQQMETPGTTYPDCVAAGDRYLMAGQVNDFLRQASRVREVGTDFQIDNQETITLVAAAGGIVVGATIGAAIGSVIPGIGTAFGAAVGAVIGAFAGIFGSHAVMKCVERPGDWDMTMVGLIRVVSDYGTKLDPNVQLHVLQDLLSEKGGADKVRTICTFCIWKVNETENHILQTESSRYLANQLWADYVASLSPGAVASNDFINANNGLRDWLLSYLRGLFYADFHEYNARPYSGHSIRALQNLNDYAQDSEVRDAARMILHYLSAKFAVSNNGLRRNASFRRRFERCEWVGSLEPGRLKELQVP